MPNRKKIPNGKSWVPRRVINHWGTEETEKKEDQKGAGAMVASPSQKSLNEGVREAFGSLTGGEAGSIF